MDFVAGNTGWIEVICEPMFSGKSEELMRRLRRARIALSMLERYYPGAKATEKGTSFPGIPVEKSEVSA